MRAAGVTDRELLHHLLFCMDYNAKKNDPRPLPHGAHAAAHKSMH